MEQQAPCSLESEQAVVASVLKRPEQFVHLRDIIGPEAFWFEPMGWAWRAIGELYDQNLCIDSVTVCDQLERDGKLIDFSLPGSKQFMGRAAFAGIREIETSDTGEAYALNVQDYHGKRTILKWLNNAAAGCLNGRTSATIISDLQTQFGKIKLHSGKINRFSNDLDDANIHALAASERASHGEKACPTGFADLDKIIYIQNGELVVVAGRPGQGKSSFLKDVAVFAARSGKSVNYFVLEAGHVPLMQRIQSKLSGIPTYRIKQGKLSPEEWEYLRGDITQQIATLNIRIIDLPGITIGEIRTEARRNPADILILDYIQLANADESNERRDLDIGKITAGLKGLAVERDIPILAAAQVGRGAEARADKRPALNDLRECLSIKTSQVYYNNNVLSPCLPRRSVVSIKYPGDTTVNSSIVLEKKSNLVYRLSLQSGRFVDCTEDHAILTSDGYKPLKEINKNDSVAVLLNFGNWENTRTIPEAELIGWMLGNGSMIKYAAPSFITADPIIAKMFRDTVIEKWGFTPHVHIHHTSNVFQYDLTYSDVRTNKPNIVTEWFKKKDLWGRRSFEKKIPDWFMEQADEESICALLAGLWETDGSVHTNRFTYATTSSVLKDQMIYLLAKIGIFAFVDGGYLSSKATVPCYKITIADRTFVDVFNSKIYLHGVKGNKQKNIKKGIASRQSNKIGLNTSIEIKEFFDINVPPEIARIQGYGRRITQWFLKESIKNARKYFGENITPLQCLGINTLDWLCSKNIAWDLVDSIKLIGNEDVFDRQVDNEHNFVVNGVIVHNSGAIENDADTVVFLYPKNDLTDAGYHVVEAIVAKHRDGPTDTCTLLFKEANTEFVSKAFDSQPSLNSRLRNMEPKSAEDE